MSGRRATDRCDIRAALPEMSCHPDADPRQPTHGVTTRPSSSASQVSVSYLIPKVEVQVAGTFRSDQGGDLAANWAAPGQGNPSGDQTVGLNRPYAGVAGTTVQVNLIEPGTLYGDRVNQIDLRFAKISEVRADENERRVRHLQHHEREPSVDLQRGVQSNDHGLADTAVGAPVAVRQVQRSDRFLRLDQQAAPKPRGSHLGAQGCASDVGRWRVPKDLPLHLHRLGP